jgi:hypothetical protein
MIKNEREYRIANAAAARFREAIAEISKEPDSANSADDWKRSLFIDATKSQLDDLNAEITDYERLRSSPPSGLPVNSLNALPTALIQARVAAGMTQKSLAETLNMKEQQIQRYEATGFASASLTRLIAIASALGVELQGEMKLGSTATAGKDAA